MSANWFDVLLVFARKEMREKFSCSFPGRVVSRHVFRIGTYYFRHVRRIEISLPREIKVNIKVKISPAHAMKEYRGSGGDYKNSSTYS
jgi:hypothetical protein